MFTTEKKPINIPAEHRDLVEKIKEEKEKFVAERKKKEEEERKAKVDKLVNEPIIEGRPGIGTTGGEPQDEKTKERRQFIRKVFMISSIYISNRARNSD